jgi:hypothetical protein
MTMKEFIGWLIGYYGHIPEGQRTDLVAYLDGLAPSYLAALKGAVMRRFSSQYGKVPDIAVLEECSTEARTGMREIQESRAAALLEAPAERGTGELMEIDWLKIFSQAEQRAKRIAIKEDGK